MLALRSHRHEGNTYLSAFSSTVYTYRMDCGVIFLVYRWSRSVAECKYCVKKHSYGNKEVQTIDAVQPDCHYLVLCTMVRI